MIAELACQNSLERPITVVIIGSRIGSGTIMGVAAAAIVGSPHGCYCYP